MKFSPFRRDKVRGEDGFPGFGGRVKGKGSFKGRVLELRGREGGGKNGRGGEKKRRRKRDWGVEVKKRFRGRIVEKVFPGRVSVASSTMPVISLRQEMQSTGDSCWGGGLVFKVATGSSLSVTSVNGTIGSEFSYSSPTFPPLVDVCDINGEGSLSRANRKMHREMYIDDFLERKIRVLCSLCFFSSRLFHFLNKFGLG